MNILSIVKPKLIGKKIKVPRGDSEKVFTIKEITKIDGGYGQMLKFTFEEDEGEYQLFNFSQEINIVE